MPFSKERYGPDGKFFFPLPSLSMPGKRKRTFHFLELGNQNLQKTHTTRGSLKWVRFISNKLIFPGNASNCEQAGIYLFAVCSSMYLIIYLSNTYLLSINSIVGSVPGPELIQKEAIRGLVLVEEMSPRTYGLLILSWGDPNTLLKSVKR